MLQEFIQEVARLAVNASGIHVERLDNRTRLVTANGGEPQEYTVPAPQPEDSLGSLSSFAAYVADHAKASGATAAAYVGDMCAWAILDPKERTGTAKLELGWTARFTRLGWLASASTNERKLDSLSAARLLTVDFAGCGGEVMAQRLRRLDFERREGGHAHSDRGGESLGKSIEARVQGVEDIPDTFSLKIPVFRTSGFRAIVLEVQFYVELHPRTPETPIEIGPLPDEFERALDDATAEAFDKIAESLGSHARVYMGEPGNCEGFATFGVEP